MRPIDEFRPALPPVPCGPIAVLQSQFSVRQTCPVGHAIQATVNWCRVRRPERVIIALRTGLPSWIGHQAINRGWPLHVFTVADTLERTGDDLLPGLLELWLAAAEQTIVSSPIDRDRQVAAAAEELTIDSILTTVLRSEHNHPPTTRKARRP